MAYRALTRLQSLFMLLTEGFLDNGCLQQAKVRRLWGEFWPGNKLAAKQLWGRPAALYFRLQVLPLLPCLLPSETQPKLLFLDQTAVVASRFQLLLGYKANTTYGSASETTSPRVGWAQVATPSLTWRSKPLWRSQAGAPPINVLWKSHYTMVDCFPSTLPAWR